MLIGLARTTTLEQVSGLEGQIRDLEAFGCERVFKEHVSSVAEREQLKAALGLLRTGDKPSGYQTRQTSKISSASWSNN